MEVTFKCLSASSLHQQALEPPKRYFEATPHQIYTTTLAGLSTKSILCAKIVQLLACSKQPQKNINSKRSPYS